MFNILKILYSKRSRMNFYFYCFAKTSNNFAKKIIALLLKNNGIGIEASSKIGQGFNTPHPYCIVIGEHAILGNNITIYQNVTIGQKGQKYPKIGNNCIIYPNTVVFGGIEIGDNCIIGAGSVVNKSFPANSVIAGNPAKAVK